MSDLIERQRILKKVSDIDEINKRMVVNYNDPKVLIVNSVIKQMQKIMIGMIENAPTIEPERKNGKWTKDCACEICGFKPWYERDIHTLSFCPNCGADMREDQDGKSD